MTLFFPGSRQQQKELIRRTEGFCHNPPEEIKKLEEAHRLCLSLALAPVPA